MKSFTTVLVLVKQFRAVLKHELPPIRRAYAHLKGSGEPKVSSHKNVTRQGFLKSI